MNRSRAAAIPVLGLLLALLLGCSAAVTSSSAAVTTAPHTHAPASRAPAAAPAQAAPPPVDRKTVTAYLTVPAIGIKHLKIVPYEGTTDDWPGTRIQDRGLAASPWGPHGGAGPGETGNYLVTGHRLAGGGPFREVPQLKNGDKVLIAANGVTYTYTITDTRKTDFRSADSLRDQRAAVPDHPGRKPTRAMITVSTCATLEDNAAGNFWRDSRDNPQHRIDKIGVLTSWSKGGAGGGS